MLNADDMAFMRQMQGLAAPAAEEPVTFYAYAGEVPGNRAAGEPDTPAYDPPAGLPIQAVANPVTLEVQNQVGGRVTDGDVVFQIRCSQLARAPTGQDVIAWAGARYQPVRVTSAHLVGALYWVARCSRL